MIRLLISAAHTLENPGAIFGELREADLTRKIVQKITPYLDKEKIEYQAVSLDLPLIQRIDWINQTGYTEENGDIFIEIHVNDGGKRGIETWFSGQSAEGNKSQEFADIITKELTASTSYQDQGIKSEYDHELGSLLILNQTNTISIAIELLYIDNPEDNAILKDDTKLDDLAKKLVDAIKKYIDKKKDEPKSISTTPTSTNKTLPSPFGANFSKGFGANPFDTTGDSIGNSGSRPTGGMFSPATTTSNSSSSMMMDREQRKTMIIDTYKKLLGKEPKQSDINYFLNIGVTEQQLVDRVFKSKDHSKMIEDAKETEDLRTKVRNLEADFARIQAKLNDLESINANLNTLLKYKNHQINQMNAALQQNNIIKNGQYFDYNTPQTS